MAFGSYDPRFWNAASVLFPFWLQYHTFLVSPGLSVFSGPLDPALLRVNFGRRADSLDAPAHDAADKDAEAAASSEESEVVRGWAV